MMGKCQWHFVTALKDFSVPALYILFHFNIKLNRKLSGKIKWLAVTVTCNRDWCSFNLHVRWFRYILDIIREKNRRVSRKYCVTSSSAPLCPWIKWSGHIVLGLSICGFVSQSVYTYVCKLSITADLYMVQCSFFYMHSSLIPVRCHQYWPPCDLDLYCLTMYDPIRGMFFVTNMLCLST